MTDRDLLRKYVDETSDAAFARLVSQHMKLVYYTCRRDVRDPQLAEDVTQAVFMLLARKAPTLGRDVSVSGWLFNTARLVSRNAVRREQRRRRAEAEASVAMMESTRDNRQWTDLEAWLNTGLSKLSTPERDAILLRYFNELSIQELAGELGITVGAAQMRVSRGLSNLRKYMAKKDIAVTVAALAVFLADRQSEAMPLSLPASTLQAMSAQAPAAMSSHAWLLHKEVARHLAGTMRRKAALSACGVAALSTLALIPVLVPQQDHSTPATISHTRSASASVSPPPAPAVKIVTRDVPGTSQSAPATQAAAPPPIQDNGNQVAASPESLLPPYDGATPPAAAPEVLYPSPAPAASRPLIVRPTAWVPGQPKPNAAAVYSAADPRIASSSPSARAMAQMAAAPSQSDGKPAEKSGVSPLGTAPVDGSLSPVQADTASQPNEKTPKQWYRLSISRTNAQQLLKLMGSTQPR